MANTYKQVVEKVLSSADVRINGKRPWDIQVHDERLYKRFLAQGSLGAGEAFMDGWWTTHDLEDLVRHAFRAEIDDAFQNKLQIARAAVAAKMTNRQSISRAYKNVQHHYDIGNDLYIPMLGKTMAYTCGYWEKARTLDQAQEAKFDLICRKLGLKRGMSVLDIGCGWGGFVEYAATHYGVKCVGITLSEEQVTYAKERTKGLPVKIMLQDYRELKHAPFDRVLSIGILEHVGQKNYRTFMEVNARHLKDDGLMLLHTIGRNHQVNKTDPWMERYIFPGVMLPAIQEIATAMTDIFIMEDFHNFGPDYAKTLRAWWHNFDKAYPKLDHTKYDERFYRMWQFYLLCCAANFATRGLQLWQIVATKPKAGITYRSVR
jgi:cyclopropane-fatty-acyl-phospholipid synthase